MLVQRVLVIFTRYRILHTHLCLELWKTASWRIYILCICMCICIFTNTFNIL